MDCRSMNYKMLAGSLILIEAKITAGIPLIVTISVVCCCSPVFKLHSLLSQTDSIMKFTAASVIVGLSSAQAFMVQPTMKTSGP